MNPTENLAAAVAALKTARKQLDEVNTGPSEGRYLAGARACRAAMLAERAVADAALAWGDWHAENKAQAEEVLRRMAELKAAPLVICLGPDGGAS